MLTSIIGIALLITLFAIGKYVKADKA